LLTADFGAETDISNLPPQEQRHFLDYFKDRKESEIAPIQNFCRLYGLTGVRTFLSLERGDESLGDAIVAFGAHSEQAGEVFQYYGELLDSAERAEELVREVTGCEGADCMEQAALVRENILNRAQKDLEAAVRSDDAGDVTALVQNYVAAAKEYVALLQEVGAGGIESIASGELSAEDQKRMRVLLRSNYDGVYEGVEYAAFKTAVEDSLTNSFTNPDTTFRVLRDEGEIVSFNRFDTVRDVSGREVSYFGSFNADPAYSGVGGVMLEETIKDRLEDGRPMMAYADPGQSVTRKYIENGFVATELHPFSGETLFEIWRKADSPSQFETKQKTVAELLATENTESVVVREQTEAETYPELQQNKALTRYFNKDGKVYLVFETLPEHLRDEFVAPQQEQSEAA
jgi:hypothetical protein